jgi:Smr domain
MEKGPLSASEFRPAKEEKKGTWMRNFFARLFSGERRIEKMGNQANPVKISPPAEEPPEVSQNKPDVRVEASKPSPDQGPGPAAAPKPQGKGIEAASKNRRLPDLTRLDDAAFYEKLTGERPAGPMDLAPLKANPEKDSEPTLRRSKAERMRAAPHKPQDELDLHGKKAEGAAADIRRFVRESAARGLRKVRIITGKGLHSENGLPILVRVADEEIRRLINERKAFAFEWEKGNGSLVVYLA